VTTRQALIGAAIAGLALRLAFGLLYWVDKPLTRDEREYLSLARSLAAGRGFVYDVAEGGPQDPFGRAPGYPAFLVLAGGGRSSSESVPTSVKASQAVIGAVGVLLVGAIARRLAGDRAAAIAATIAAVYPPLVWISAYALSEAVFWPLGLFVVWLFDRASGDRRLPFVAGMAAGGAVLVRPGIMLFLAFAGAWLLVRRQFWVVVMLALGSALIITPWTIRNAAQHGRLVMVASEGGVTFWTGNHPRAIGEGDLNANPHLKVEAQALRARHPHLNEEEMEPIYYREALAWMIHNPVDWLVLEARKVFYLIVPIGPSYWLHSTRYVVASLVSYLLVLPFAVIGFVRLHERRGRSPGLWLLAASAVATCLIFFPQERFRIPIIDPALIVCAACWFAGRTR
jgi:4-amino-4-deoxy-L-arabinose transferase-like glycosyltransferase